jgi:hypothetical protein
MKCLVCGADAERTPDGIGGTGIVCPVCGTYDIENAVIAAGQLRELVPEERSEILEKAKRSAQPGTRPLIRPFLLS